MGHCTGYISRRKGVSFESTVPKYARNAAWNLMNLIGCLCLRHQRRGPASASWLSVQAAESFGPLLCLILTPTIEMVSHYYPAEAVLDYRITKLIQF